MARQRKRRPSPACLISRSRIWGRRKTNRQATVRRLTRSGNTQPTDHRLNTKNARQSRLRELVRHKSPSRKAAVNSKSATRSSGGGVCFFYPTHKSEMGQLMKCEMKTLHARSSPGCLSAGPLARAEGDAPTNRTVYNSETVTTPRGDPTKSSLSAVCLAIASTAWVWYQV